MTQPPPFDDDGPPGPRTAEEWLRLPELAPGRHLVADVGLLATERKRAAAAGILDLPTPSRRTKGYVALPVMTVIAEDGRMRMFRLPAEYAERVVNFLRRWEGALRLPFPCQFFIGDRDNVELVDEDETEPGRMLVFRRLDRPSN